MHQGPSFNPLEFNEDDDIEWLLFPAQPLDQEIGSHIVPQVPLPGAQTSDNEDASYIEEVSSEEPLPTRKRSKKQLEKSVKDLQKEIQVLKEKIDRIPDAQAEEISKLDDSDEKGFKVGKRLIKNKYSAQKSRLNTKIKLLDRQILLLEGNPDPKEKDSQIATLKKENEDLKQQVENLSALLATKQDSVSVPQQEYEVSITALSPQKEKDTKLTFKFNAIRATGSLSGSRQRLFPTEATKPATTLLRKQ